MEKQNKKINSKCNFEYELNAQLCSFIESEENMSTCTNNTSTNNLTHETILQAKKLMESVKDPISEYMNKHGYDTEKGDKIILPASMIDVFENLPVPSYVRIVKNKYLKAPFMVKGFNIGDLKIST